MKAKRNYSAVLIKLVCIDCTNKLHIVLYSSEKTATIHIIRLKNVLRGTIGNNKQSHAMSPVAKNER